MSIFIVFTNEIALDSVGQGDNATDCTALPIGEQSLPRRSKVLRRVLFGCWAGIFTSVPTAFATAEVFPLALEPQTLYSALSTLSQIARFQIAGISEYFKGHIIAPLKGDFTAREAVAELLKGTHIQYEWEDDKTLIILDKALPPPSAQSSRHNKGIEEVTVVGSHIRGTNSAAPVFQFTRKDIENSGLTTTQEFVGSLPQMFGGGASEGAISSIKGAGANTNIASASGVNLRGLGNDSTLTLLNGRRIAPAGFGDVVDISTIPLNAIERIEVLTDGASAIYGSDAVGGVVNITLRKNYEGNETQIGYGDVTSGNNEQYRFSQTSGMRWDKGSTLFSYSYLERDDLNTDDRSVAETAADPSDLLGMNKQHNLVFSINQQLSQWADLYVDALYSERESEINSAAFMSSIGVQRVVTSGLYKQYSLTSGANVELNDRWELDTSLLYSGSSTTVDIVSLFSTRTKAEFDMWQLNVKVDGDVFDVRENGAKLAMGIQLRREALTSESVVFTGKEKIDRNIFAGFAEMFIPIVGEGNELWGVERLELTFAGRYEEYNDFGSTTNPKVGVLWAPVRSVDIRATYAKSFRAPVLFELSEKIVPTGATTAFLQDPLASDGVDTPSLLLIGHNPDLESEEAINWTLGIDFYPTIISDFSLSLTYFDIDFSNRIQKAIPDNQLFFALLESAYAPIVTRNPDMALIDFWVSHPNFSDAVDLQDFSKIEAVVDNRLLNISSVRERGLDFSIDYSAYTAMGEFNFQLGGSYLLKMESKLTEMASFVDILNTTYNPVDLKLRNIISWRRDPITATMSTNYVDSYKDTRFEPDRDIHSWTTMDFNFRYSIREENSTWLGDTVFSVSIQNVFDKKPPFVANDLGYNFDATNANAIGRRIFLDITKRW